MASYNTRQREAIREYMASLKGEHVTADQVVAHFADSAQLVGRTTIYRHLEKLVQDGQARKYKVEGHSSACFQYIEEPETCSKHFHLRCDYCGRLSHLECAVLHDIEGHVLDEHAFRIDPLKTVFFGVCDSCLRKHDNGIEFKDSVSGDNVGGAKPGEHE